MKTRRRDAGNSEGAGADSETPPNDGRVVSVAALPEVIAQDNERLLLGRTASFAAKPAAGNRLQTQQGEIVAANEFTGKLFIHFTGAEQHRHTQIGEHARKHVVVIAIERIVGIRTAAQPAFRASMVDRDHPLGFRDRQGTQQDPVDEAKDRNVDADPQGKRENRDSGESRAPPQRAQCVAQVLGQSFKPAPPPGVRAHLFQERRVPELPPGRVSGLLGGHPVLLVVPGLHFQVGLDLLFELALETLATEEHAQSPPELTHGGGPRQG